MPNATLATDDPPPFDPDQAQRPVCVLAARHPAGAGGVHSHRADQLIYAIAGVLRVMTQDGMWVVPPQRAVWVPAGVAHRVDSARPFDLCTMYIAKSLRPAGSAFADRCHVVAVTPLLREMLRRAAGFGDRYARKGSESRLLAAAIDQIEGLDTIPLRLPMPTERRVRAVAEQLHGEPGIPHTLAEWGSRVGASRRTLERLFRAETGMSFVEWRGQARLLAALQSLAAGSSVTQAAFDVGYADVSSFITMFKRALGTTPRGYFNER